MCQCSEVYASVIRRESSERLDPQRTQEGSQDTAFLPVLSGEVLWAVILGAEPRPGLVSPSVRPPSGLRGAAVQ